MNTTGKVLLIGGGFVIIAGVGAYLLLSGKKPTPVAPGAKAPAPPGRTAKSSGSKASTPAPVAPTPAASVSTDDTDDTGAGLNFDLVLQDGDRGPEVKRLQGDLGVKQDSIFGPITLGALQNQTGLDYGSLNEIEPVLASQESADGGNKMYPGSMSMSRFLKMV